MRVVTLISVKRKYVYFNFCFNFCPLQDRVVEFNSSLYIIKNTFSCEMTELGLDGFYIIPQL